MIPPAMRQILCLPRSAIFLLIGLTALLTGCDKMNGPGGSSDLGTQSPSSISHVAGDKKSGYLFSAPDIRALQDDDSRNPAQKWVNEGRKIWGTIEGQAGRSCASCHGDSASALRGVATTYPHYEPALGKLIDLEQRINHCRTEHMRAEPWKWESKPLLSITALVKMQSRGMPMAVISDGAAKAFFDRGRDFYYQRRGQLDLSCAQCHDQNVGKMLRGETLSQGQSTGYPLYRLKWQGLGSLHRRFVTCNEIARAEPYPLGSEEYVDLELFLAARSNGLAIETPAVRK